MTWLTKPCTGCCYGIRLGIQRTPDYETDLSAGQFVRLWIDQQEGFGDDSLFVYQRHTLNPETGEFGGFFSNVASPNDYEELPVGEPADTDTTTKLFRLDYVEAYFESRAAADDFVTAVSDDIELLIQAMKQRCRDLTDPSYVVFE